MGPRGSPVTDSMLVFVDCWAKCQTGYWEEFTSQPWPPDWCPWFFWDFAFLGFSSQIFLGLQVGPALTRFCHLGKFWLHTSPGRVGRELVPLAAHWAVDHA